MVGDKLDKAILRIYAEIGVEKQVDEGARMIFRAIPYTKLIRKFVLEDLERGTSERMVCIKYEITKSALYWIKQNGS